MADPTSEPVDADLAVRARGGDRDSYRTLVERYQEVAFRTAYLITRSAVDAEDAAQDAFVKAYLRLDRFDPRRPFRPWLLTIVANEAKNRRRAEGRRLHYEATVARHGAAPEATPEAAAVLEEASGELLAAVNALPEPERLVVGLRYFLELSEAETADIAGIPSGTVKSRLSRALGRLRVAMGDPDD